MAPVTKARYQNPVIGDIVQLQLFVYNSNMYAELQQINFVNIFYLDRTKISCDNPTGKVLVQTIPGSEVQNLAQGEYQLSLFIDPTIYEFTGRYVDEWNVTFMSGDEPATLTHLFQIYPELWFTTPIPVVYDFNFYFQPNRLKHGAKQFIQVQIIPNVPTATDLGSYYENLAIVAEVFVTMSLECGPCIPCEADLRTVIDHQPVQYREKNRAYYFMDTSLYDCGIYNIVFEMNFGASTYISDTNQFQIYT